MQLKPYAHQQQRRQDHVGARRWPEWT